MKKLNEYSSATIVRGLVIVGTLLVVGVLVILAIVKGGDKNVSPKPSGSATAQQRVTPKYPSGGQVATLFGRATIYQPKGVEVESPKAWEVQFIYCANPETPRSSCDGLKVFDLASPMFTMPSDGDVITNYIAGDCKTSPAKEFPNGRPHSPPTRVGGEVAEQFTFVICSTGEPKLPETFFYVPSKKLLVVVEEEMLPIWRRMQSYLNFTS